MALVHPDDCITEAQRLSRSYAILRRLWQNYSTLGADFLPLYYRCMNEIDNMFNKARAGDFIVSRPLWADAITKANWDGEKFLPPKELDIKNEESVLSCILYLESLLTFSDVT